jgi:predicted enzyme related to lactoylglutathione lyase
MVPRRVSLITIGAIDLPMLRRFYQKLGWSETAISSDEYCVFETAGVLLSLYPLQQLAKDAGIELSTNKEMVSGISLSINVNNPADVDQVILDIEITGGKIVRQPYDAAWGGRVAYFVDPENNLWEVAWNPTALFDDRGALITF